MNKTVAVIVVLVISFILVVVVACSRIQESGEVEGFKAQDRSYMAP
jgi:hypothetical protein